MIKKLKMSSMYYIKNEMLYLIPLTICKAFNNALVEVEPVIDLKLPTTSELLKEKLQECFSLCCMEFMKEIPKDISVLAKHVGVKTQKQVVSTYDNIGLLFDKKQKKYRIDYDSEKGKNYYLNGKVEYLDEQSVYDFILKIIQD